MEIPGLPLGTKIESLVLRGEGWQKEGNGERIDYDSVVRLIPDNLYGTIDLESVAIPEGCERVEKDWFREPKAGEYYVGSIKYDGDIVRKAYVDWSKYYPGSKRIIIRPKQKKTKRFLVIDPIEIIGQDETGYYVSSQDISQWVSKQVPSRIELREVD